MTKPSSLILKPRLGVWQIIAAGKIFGGFVLVPDRTTGKENEPRQLREIYPGKRAGIDRTGKIK
jgi:hypothetical protein